MRTHLLGLAAAALTAGTLALVPGSPAGAAGGIDGGNISTSGDVPNSVDVAAFGSGDALAAWARPVPGGTKVYAAVATDGVWGAPKAVTASAVTDAHDVRAVANDAGDLAVIWNQTTGGEHKVRGSRYLANGTWDGSTLLSPTVEINTLEDIDAGIDAAGRVHVAYEARYAGVPRVRTAVWRKDAVPVLDAFPKWSWSPSLDVNPAGQVVLAYYDGTDILVTRRTATLGWLGPRTVPWPAAVVGQTETVVADDGRGAVMLAGHDGEHYRAVVTRVGVDGTLGNPKILSAAGVEATHQRLSVSPNGTLQASWATFEGAPNGNLIRVATAKPGADFGPSGVVEAKLSGPTAHVNLVSDRGVQVVAHADQHVLTLRHRSNPVLLFSDYEAGATNGPLAADMDRHGDVVVAGVVENGFSSYVEADWLDLNGPVSTVTAPGAQVLAKSFDVAWSSVDALSGTKSTDLLVSSAAWNSATFGPTKVLADDVTGTVQHVTGGLGRTYCYEVQSADKAGNLGLRSVRRCTAVPLDDTALAGSGWTRAARAHQFNGTWTTTTTKGRTLTRTGVKARRLALVAQRVPTGGKVRVTWNGTTIRTISLKGSAANRVVFPIITWGNVRSGTLQLKVVSPNGSPVRVDGLVVAK